MKRVILELTDRCNLNCHHCFSGRHGGRTELEPALIERVLGEARACGFDGVSMTGGEATIHRKFLEIVDLVCVAGYTFSVNTNGWNFVSLYPKLLPYRDHLRTLTFSLDGASEATHDQLRGKGSFHRVLQAMSVCFIQKFPFGINMVVTAHNRHELADMVRLATTVGANALRFGHLMPSTLTTNLGWDLSPWERKVVETQIWQLRASAAIPISMAAGSYTTDLFPCSPLNGQSVNIDCRGNLTKCCVLSGHGPGVGEEDIVGSLYEMSFADGWQQIQAENERFRAAKIAHLHSERWQDADFFPCWYCSNHYRKVDWLSTRADHSWQPLLWMPEKEINA
jgi:MoaA/NifB/PqqE/SkfB family radical SAM enzyme